MTRGRAQTRRYDPCSSALSRLTRRACNERRRMHHPPEHDDRAMAAASSRQRPHARQSVVAPARRRATCRASRGAAVRPPARHRQPLRPRRQTARAAAHLPGLQDREGDSQPRVRAQVRAVRGHRPPTPPARGQDAARARPRSVATMRNHPRTWLSEVPGGAAVNPSPRERRAATMTTTAASPFLSDAVEPQYVHGPAARHAYRRFGKTESLPLVFCTRFRATIDHLDPALLDLLAAEREIIVFDNVGTGASTGTTPATIQGLADGAVQFIEALGLTQVA